MSADPYNERVRALFDEPAHAGYLDDAAGTTIEDQGVRICFSTEVAGGEMRALRFQAWGCPHFIAAAEAFCDGYEGRPVSALSEFSASELMQSLSVPVEKTGRILVIEDAVRSLAQIVREPLKPEN